MDALRCLANRPLEQGGRPADGAERRAKHRYHMRLPVAVSHGDASHKTHTRNLSVGGMFLELPDLPLRWRVR